MILISIFVCFCLAAAVNYFRTRRQRKFIKNLKGPFSFPLLGSLHKILLLTPQNFFKNSAAYLAKYGNLTRCWAFHRLFIFVADLEFAAHLLHSESHVQTGAELMSDWFNESSLMCAAEQWPQRHAQLIEIFRPERVLQQRKLWQQQQSLLQAKFLEQAASREAFDVQPLVSSHVLDIVLLSNCGMQPSEQYKQSFLDLTKLYRKRFLSIKSANRLTFRLTSPFVHRRQQRLIKRLNKDNRLMIDELRQQLDLMSSGIVIERFELAKKLEHGSLLQLLLTGAEQQLSEAQLLAELNACNYLAYMLISTTLCFALVQIARHPGVQQRCLEELRAQSEEQQLSELPYLDAVLKETLRLQPAQLWLARQLTEDYDYTHSQLGAGSLPLGAEIYMNLFALQRSSDDYGALPTKFEPTRFLAAHPVELLSFGLGPRRCPAQDYSLLLLKTLLAPLLRQFELLPNGEPLRLDLHLTLGSKNGFQLALKQREAIN